MTGLYFWHFCEEIFITDAYTGVEALIYFEYLAHRRGLGAICAVRGRKTTVWGQRQKELNPQQEALAAQHSPALPLLADNAGHCPWAPAPVCVRPVKAPRGPGAPPRPSGPVFACAATRRRAVGRWRQRVVGSRRGVAGQAEGSPRDPPGGKEPAGGGEGMGGGSGRAVPQPPLRARK